MEQIPMPGPPIFWRWAERLHFPALSAVGMCMRYGIYLQREVARDAEVLLHECAHTAQYERAGGIKPFLGEYLRQCLRDGYANAAWEREACETVKAVGGLGRES